MFVRSLVLLFVPSLVLAQAPDQARLTIGQDVYNVPIGKAFAVKIGSERVTMRFDLAADRSFAEGGVAFRYPATFEAAAPGGGEGAKVWTLQGRSAAVMVQRYDAGLDPKSLRDVLVENLVKREGSKGAKPQAVKLAAGDRTFNGVQLRSQRAAQGGAPATEMVENVFTFANAEGVFALMVQDVHPQGEKESAEYGEALKLLSESLEAGEEPERPKAVAKPAR